MAKEQLNRYATPEQVRSILLHQLRLMEERPDLAHQLPPLMLWGPPGVGKSSIIRDLCEAEEIDFIDIRLSQREPVDLRGLPVPRGDAVEWLISGDWPRDPASRGIILFDELTAADRSLQVAAYELILDRRLGKLYTLPDGWFVVAAGNRVEDRAVAQMISSALANRFCHLELQPDLESWCAWASANQLHPDVIGFLRFRPEAFFSMKGPVEQGWPSPRSWARVARTVEHAGVGLDAHALFLMVQGLVGGAAATEFLAFRRSASSLPDIPAMLLGRCPISVPDRADQRFAFCSALAHHLWKGPTEQQPRRLERFFAISMALSADFATLALLDATAGETEAQRETRSRLLFSHPDFEPWTQKHGTVFGRYLAEAA